MSLVLQKFYADTERLQSDEILLCGHKVEIFSRDNSKLLDQCVGLCSYCVDYYVVSVAIYPRTKYSVHRDNPQNHPKGKFDTPLYYQEIIAQTIKELETSYNEHLVDDRASGDLHKTGKYVPVIGKAIFPRKSLF